MFGTDQGNEDVTMNRPHSPSSLSTADTCPARWYRERVVGDVPRLASRATERGSRIHRDIERALRGEGAWPEEFPHVRGAYGHLLVGPGVQAEREMAVDRDFRPTEFDGPRAWLRGIADLLVWDAGQGRLVVVDWKSGRRFLDERTDRPKAQDQMDVYAALAFAHSEAVAVVETRLEWLVPKKRDTVVYDREPDMKRLVATVRDVAEALDARVEQGVGAFSRRANGLCRTGYCPILDCDRNTGKGEKLFPAIRFKSRPNEESMT